MDLFRDVDTVLNTNGKVEMFRSYLQDDSILNELSHLVFEQNYITIYGARHPIPRLELWFSSHSYKYSGVIIKPNVFPKWLQQLKENIEKLTGFYFNSVLINKYRDGNDKVDWHQDNEPILGQGPVIASLSIGETRKFKFREKDNKSNIVNLLLKDGDLILMHKGVQENWEHCLPRTSRYNGVRYNLTFRKIVTR